MFSLFLLDLFYGAIGNLLWDLMVTLSMDFEVRVDLAPAHLLACVLFLEYLNKLCQDFKVTFVELFCTTTLMDLGWGLTFV